MKTFKKILAVSLLCCLLLTLCACHGKDEVALTIEGMDIKSGLYLNALVDCDSEAKQRVDDEVAAAETEETTTTEETDYYSKTLDGLSFVDYVKAEAIDRCKEFVFYQKLVDDGTIKLTDDEIAEAENYAQYYWSSYSYSLLYEANGVSYDTYKKAFTYSYYSNAYFKHLYGEGGEKEVAKKDIKENMLDNYALAYVLSATYEENATDDQKADLKTKLQGYGTRLQKGEDFQKIYNELNGTSEEATQTTEDGPKDVNAQIIADENSNTIYANADFDTVYEMEKGSVEIIETEDATGLTLYLRLDIESDDYYLTTLTDTILYDLKEEEFNDYVSEKTAKYSVEENSWAINRFDVEDIDYSALEALYSTTAA